MLVLQRAAETTTRKSCCVWEGEKSCFDSHPVTINLHFSVLKPSVSLEKPNNLLPSPMLRWNLIQGLKYQLPGPSFLLIHLSDTSSLANIWRRDARYCSAAVQTKLQGGASLGPQLTLFPLRWRDGGKKPPVRRPTCSSTRRQRNRFQMQIKNNHAEAWRWCWEREREREPRPRPCPAPTQQARMHICTVHPRARWERVAKQRPHICPKWTTEHQKGFFHLI